MAINFFTFLFIFFSFVLLIIIIIIIIQNSFTSVWGLWLWDGYVLNCTYMYIESYEAMLTINKDSEELHPINLDPINYSLIQSPPIVVLGLIENKILKQQQYNWPNLRIIIKQQKLACAYGLCLFLVGERSERERLSVLLAPLA